MANTDYLDSGNSKANPLKLSYFRFYKPILDEVSDAFRLRIPAIRNLPIHARQPHMLQQSSDIGEL